LLKGDNMFGFLKGLFGTKDTSNVQDELDIALNAARERNYYANTKQLTKPVQKACCNVKKKKDDDIVMDIVETVVIASALDSVFSSSNDSSSDYSSSDTSTDWSGDGGGFSGGGASGDF